MSVVQGFHFNISEVKEGNEHSQRFDGNSSEVKQHSGHSKIFHLNNKEKVKQRSELCQIYHFKGSEMKEGSGLVRDFFLIVLILNSVLTDARDLM